MVHANVYAAATVKVANDRNVAGLPKLNHLIVGIQLVIVVGVQVEGAIAVNANLFDSVSRPIANDWNISFLSEHAFQVFIGQAAVAVDV